MRIIFCFAIFFLQTVTQGIVVNENLYEVNLKGKSRLLKPRGSPLPSPGTPVNPQSTHIHCTVNIGYKYSLEKVDYYQNNLRLVCNYGDLDCYYVSTSGQPEFTLDDACPKSVG